MAQEKTNSMRALEARKIPYDVFTFSPDVHSATGVADEDAVEESERPLLRAVGVAHVSFFTNRRGTP